MAAVQGHEYGPTGKAATGGAAGGASVGVAIVELIVYLIPHLEPVSGALNILVGAALAAAGAAVAAKYTPSSSVRRQREEAAAAWDAAAASAPMPVSAVPVGSEDEQQPDAVFTASQVEELQRLLATASGTPDAEATASAAERPDDTHVEPDSVPRLDSAALERLRQQLT